MAEIKGRFILSINDLPDVREIFRDFRLEPVGTTYSLKRGQQKAVKELLIFNFG